VPALTSLFGEAAWWPGRRVRREDEDDLYERVAARAGIGTTQAQSATRATLCTLAERITRNETRAIAARLPRDLAGNIRKAARSPERFPADEFVHRVAEREGVPEPEARRHARAVLTALEDTSADGLAYLRGQLSDDYEDLFAAGAERPGAVGSESAEAERGERPPGPPPEPPPAEPPPAEPPAAGRPPGQPPTRDRDDGARVRPETEDTEPRIRRETGASTATDRSARPD
jgi:uncharacterized protein (DUF2267 family)